MTDFHSIYQQEINVLANSMRGRQMSKNHKNKQENPLYISVLLVFTKMIEISCFLINPLFTGLCQGLQELEKKVAAWLQKKGALPLEKRPLVKNYLLALLKLVGNTNVPGKSVSEIDPVIHIHTVPFSLSGFGVNIGVRL